MGTQETSYTVKGTHNLWRRALHLGSPLLPPWADWYRGCYYR